MFCPKCGTKHEDGAAFCTNCGMNLKQGMMSSVSESATKIENVSKSVKNKKTSNYFKDGIIAIIMGTLIFMFLWKIGFQYEKLSHENYFWAHRGEYTKHSFNWYHESWNDFCSISGIRFIAPLLPIFFWTLGVGSLIKGLCKKTNRSTTIAVGVFLCVWAIIQFFMTRSMIYRTLYGFERPLTWYLEVYFYRPLIWVFYSAFSLFFISFFLIIGTLKESPEKLSN